LPPERRVSFRTHVVVRGQTLITIAKRYGTRAEDIAQANGMASNRRLSRGTELIIPIPPQARASLAKPARTVTPNTTASGPQRVHYRIRPGDTLGSIADQYGVTVQDIQGWNRLNTTRIAAGSVLTLYTSR
jgi:LysM repeat protein